MRTILPNALQVDSIIIILFVRVHVCSILVIYKYPTVLRMSRLENNFGTSEVLFVPLISPSVKFMNHFRVFKKWYLKSF